jgi:hypothetical protein
LAFEAQSAEIELTLANATQQLNAGETPPPLGFQRFSNSGTIRCTQRMIILRTIDRPPWAIISTRSRKLSP